MISLLSEKGFNVLVSSKCPKNSPCDLTTPLFRLSIIMSPRCFPVTEVFIHFIWWHISVQFRLFPTVYVNITNWSFRFQLLAGSELHWTLKTGGWLVSCQSGSVPSTATCTHPDSTSALASYSPCLLSSEPHIGTWPTHTTSHLLFSPLSICVSFF